MFRLDRFRFHHEPLKYALPWARIVNFPNSEHAIVLNKDGSLQATLAYRGPDLDSVVKAQLSVMCQQIVLAIMGVQTGWAMWFEAQRTPATAYKEGEHFPDPITKAMDEERRDYFRQGSSHFESTYFLSIYWTVPSDNEGRLKDLVVEGREKEETGMGEHLKAFASVVDKIYGTLLAVGVPCHFLDADETFSYLHSVVSLHYRELKMPKTPMLLDRMLCDVPLAGGLEPKLGNKPLRVISIIGYLQSTCFGMLDALNRLSFPCRWVTRYYCLGKTDAVDAVAQKQKEWKSRLKSLSSLIKEITMGESSGDINEAALAKHGEASTALTAVEGDLTTFGYYTGCVVLLCNSEKEADARAKAVEQTLANIGLKAKTETLNAVEAWMGSLPSMTGHNERRDLISAGNLVHMMPLSAIWTGDGKNKHLNGPPLLYAQTSGGTPYRLNLHVGDVGHTLVTGPTGAGKSVLLNTIEAAWRKYENARAFVFDKGASSLPLTYGVGGTFYDLGNEEAGSLSFEPLAHVDDEKERQWALEWLCDYVRQENLEITPELKALLWDALGAVASYQDMSLRRMTTLVNAVQSLELKTALQPLTIQGSYGRIFDSPKDTLKLGSWQTFEMEKLMSTPAIVGPTLMYIFHRIEQSLTGEPTIIVLDECWVFFDNKQFADKIREWLKVLRKSNASVIFATQSLNDIVSSPIFATVLESCPSRIFLPNPDALEEGIAKQYAMFGINQRQLQIISAAIKKKQYYYVSPLGSRLFELALEHCPISLAYVAANTKQIREAKKMIQEGGRDAFNENWLRYRGILS